MSLHVTSIDEWLLNIHTKGFSHLEATKRRKKENKIKSNSHKNDFQKIKFKKILLRSSFTHPIPQIYLYSAEIASKKRMKKRERISVIFMIIFSSPFSVADEIHHKGHLHFTLHLLFYFGREIMSFEAIFMTFSTQSQHETFTFVK